jgi:hypothetical protein
VALPETLLNEWMKGGLVEGGRRRGNIDGIRPIFEYGCGDYRRCLQLARLRAQGIVEHDQLRLALFVAGHSVEPWDVRTALLQVYRSTVAQASRGARSRYLDKPAAGRPIPEKNQAKLIRSLGELDPDLKAAGFGLPGGLLVEIARQAKQPGLDIRPVAPLRSQIRDIVRGRIAWAGFARSAGQLLSGLYFVEAPGPTENNAPVDYVERLITTSTDEEYIKARDIFWIFLLLAREPTVLAKFIGFRGDLSLQRQAGHKIARSLGHPAWIAVMLVLSLLLAKKFNPPFNREDIRCIFSEINSHRLTIRMLWRKIGFPGLRALGLTKRN